MRYKCAEQLRWFVREEGGNAVTEYGVMLSLIVLAALGALMLLGDKLVAIFTYEYTNLEGLGS